MTPARLGGGRGLMPGSPGAADHVDARQLPKGIVGRVWREFVRPFRRKLAVLLVAIAGASALTILPARLIGYLVDAFTPPAGPEAARQVNLLALLLVAVAIGAGAFSLWQRYLSAWIGEHLIFDLRRRLFDHIQRMPLAFFTRTQTGAVVSRLNNDVLGAQRALTGTFGTIAANAVQVVVAVALMAQISLRMTLIVLAVLPLFVWLAKRVGRELQRLSRQRMERDADMNTVMNERLSVAGSLVVKLFGTPRREADQFADSAHEVAELGVRSAVVGRMFFVVMTFAGAIGTALVYWVGGRGVLAGTFTPGDVVAFGALVTMAYSPLAGLANAPVEAVTALVSFDRVLEVLDLEHPIRDADDAEELTDPRGEVVFDDVVFAYPSAADSSLASLERGFAGALDTTPGEVVLQGVSFTVPPGRTLALVGPSGAGKTTICNLVPRLYDVDAGSVRVDGHDVRELTQESLRRAVGMVTQDAHLFHDTVQANLRYAKPDATDAELEAACRSAQIHDLVTSLPEGYDTVVGERGYRMSGGEKQRLSIARVLLKDPAIVILDEATAHLDSESEAAVQAALRTALGGRTSLVIAHRLSTVLAADEIVVVQGGRIVQRGTHAELTAVEGLYADLYRTQFAPASHGAH